MDGLGNTLKRRPSSAAEPISPRKRAKLATAERDEVNKLYKPLETSPPAIRLLTLHQGEWNDAIECTLSSHFLGTDPTYDALSYVWGDPNETTHIEVNEETFSVTVNLFHALRGLRQPDREYVLWIDAICINQSSPSERAQQVGLMGDIYKSCEDTVVWMGEANPSTALHDLWLMLGALSWGGCIQDYLGPWMLDAIKILSEIVKAAWWKRMWVVQELVFAPSSTFHYGPKTMSYHDFYKLAKFVESHFPEASSGQTCKCQSSNQGLEYPRFWILLSQLSKEILRFHRIRVQQIYTHEHNYPNPPELVELAISMRLRKCSDLRDKIYALLGMIATRQSFTIDYSKTVAETYARCAVEVMKVDKSLRLLTIARTHNSSVVQDLPTWTPDWASPFLGENVALLVSAIAFRAGGIEKAAITLVKTTLRVMGVQTGIVQRVSTSQCFKHLYTFATGSRFSLADILYRNRHIEPPDGYDQPELGKYPFASRYLRAMRMIRATSRKAKGLLRKVIYASRDKLMLFNLEDGLFKMDDAEMLFFRSLLNDIMYSARNGTEQAKTKPNVFNAGNLYIRRIVSYEELCIARLYILLQLEASEHGINTDDTFGDVKRTVDLLRIFPNSDKTLFVTETGRLGLGPPSVQPGDHVVVLQGAGIPFALRPRGSKFSADLGEIQCYNLVGGCYVDGIMDGELFRDGRIDWRRLFLY